MRRHRLPVCERSPLVHVGFAPSATARALAAPGFVMVFVVLMASADVVSFCKMWGGVMCTLHNWNNMVFLPRQTEAGGIELEISDWPILRGRMQDDVMPQVSPILESFLQRKFLGMFAVRAYLTSTNEAARRFRICWRPRLDSRSQ